MKVRVILACTLLLLAALPSFAMPECRECVNLVCTRTMWAYESCYDGPDYCETDPWENCSHYNSSTVLTDWKVVSIEVSRPAQDAVAVTAPAAELPAPARVTSELK